MNMGQKLDGINFGLLSEEEIHWLKNKLNREEENRKQKTETYISVVRCDDGSEGFYVKKEDFHRIPSNKLHAFIGQTLSYGSDVRFSLESADIEQYEDHYARYEWEDFDQDDNEDTDANKRLE